MMGSVPHEEETTMPDETAARQFIKEFGDGAAEKNPAIDASFASATAALTLGLAGWTGKALDYVSRETDPQQVVDFFGIVDSVRRRIETVLDAASNRIYELMPRDELVAKMVEVGLPAELAGKLADAPPDSTVGSAYLSDEERALVEEFEAKITA